MSKLYVSTVLRKRWVLASLFVAVPGLLSPSTGRAAGAFPTAGTLGSGLARTVAQRMAQALNAQGRIQVRGKTVGPGKLVTRYVMRYQAGGREYVLQTGGPWSHVLIGNRRMAGMSSIVIGKQVFTSTDAGSHWYRSSRPGPPSALDSISLNAANVPCCVMGHGAQYVRLRLQGTRALGGAKVYALAYTCVGNGYAVTGTAFIDTKSYLPVRYTQQSKTPHVSGDFSLNYGGSFSISAPH